MLNELAAFDRSSLRTTQTRITTSLGKVFFERVASSMSESSVSSSSTSSTDSSSLSTMEESWGIDSKDPFEAVRINSLRSLLTTYGSDLSAPKLEAPKKSEAADEDAEDDEFGSIHRVIVYSEPAISIGVPPAPPVDDTVSLPCLSKTARQRQREELARLQQRPLQLFIGDISAASDLLLLQRYNISHIVNCAKGLGNYHPDNFAYRNLHWYDMDEEKVIHHFDEAADWIHVAIKQGGTVFVHCAAGVSRSATMVLAYLMRHEGLAFEQALTTLRRCRSIVCPNDGFVQQLREYEERLRAKDSLVERGPNSDQQQMNNLLTTLFH